MSHDVGSAPLPRLTSRADVQGLRAVAVAMVILSHAEVPWLQGGFVGVDVFFVVSGFLISSLLLHELTDTGRVRIGDFYARRARRILPAAAVVLIATSVFAAVELSTTKVSEIVQDVRWAAFFAANVHFSRVGEDYFEQDRPLSPVQHFWSLAVEEQFYLVWPALLLVVGLVVVRGKLQVVTVVVCAIWLLSMAWSVVLTPHSPVESFFSSATRAWELATGALLALAGHRLPRIPRLARHALSTLGLGGLTVAAVSYDASTPFPGWYALLPVLGTAALLASGTAGVVGVGRLLTLLPVRYVGDISYSLYLWHWPVLVLGTKYVSNLRSPSETVVMLALVLVLSVLSYHLIENPIRRSRGRILSGRHALAMWPVALASVLLATAWAHAHAQKILQERVAGHPAANTPVPTGRAPVSPVPLAERIADASRLGDSKAPIPFPLQNLDGLEQDAWHVEFTCYSSWDAVSHEICPLGDSKAKRTVVIYGNSHAGMWTPSLAALGQRDGYRVVAFVKVGCSPFNVEQQHQGAPYPECRAFRRWALHEIADLRPDVVILAHGGQFTVQPSPGMSFADMWTNGVSSAVQDMRHLTPEVKVISDITNLEFTPGDCITDPDATMSSCLTREQEVTRVGNALTREASERLGAHFVDVTGLVCLQHRCPLVVDQIVTYHNAGHLSATWTNEVTDEFGHLLNLFPPSPCKSHSDRDIVDQPHSHIRDQKVPAGRLARTQTGPQRMPRQIYAAPCR